METYLTFEIPGLPKMANGGHGHWAKDHKARAKWKHDVGVCLMGKVRGRPWVKARAVFTRCSFTEPDYDGLVHGFKPIVDGLVEFGLLADDGPGYLVRDYKWEKAPRKGGKIRVEVWCLEG
jgi:hypothetical protein